MLGREVKLCRRSLSEFLGCFKSRMLLSVLRLNDLCSSYVLDFECLKLTLMNNQANKSIENSSSMSNAILIACLT